MQSLYVTPAYTKGKAHGVSAGMVPPVVHESVMVRVQVAPSATASGELEAYGAPPLSVVLSEQARLQPTVSG